MELSLIALEFLNIILDSYTLRIKALDVLEDSDFCSPNISKLDAPDSPVSGRSALTKADNLTEIMSVVVEVVLLGTDSDASITFKNSIYCSGVKYLKVTEASFEVTSSISTPSNTPK
jgi:hypothetical protein